MGDTTNFITKLRRLPALPPDSLLATLDVSSLYTNIPHDEGIRPCEEYLNLRETLPSPTADLCDLMQLVLSINSLVIKTNSWYCHGCLYGPFICPFVSGKTGRRVPQNQNKLPRVWWRFINYIFVIWTHGELAFHNFMENIKCHHPSIKFTVSWSAEEVTFPDTRVYIKEVRIETDLYVKSTDRHQFLRMDSCHAKPCKIATAVSLRARHYYASNEFVWKIKII